MRVSAHAILALSLVLTPAAARAGDGPRKGPYLQHLTSDGVEVRVELAASAPVTVVVRAESRDGGAPAAPRTFSSPSALFHSVHLTGLGAATRYRYALHVGADVREGSFVTAPDGSSHAPFTFAVYGDNRSDGAAHARVVDALAKESFDFLVQTGDLVIAGADEAAWQTFFDVEAPLLRDHCVFSSIGNHELHDDRTGAHFERYFGPTEPPAGSAELALYGSFRWGRARFFLLNAFEEWGPGKERTWLEQALSESDGEAGVDLRVAVIHHGPYSAGPHGNNEQLLAAHIDGLLISHHVDLVVAGHDHIYERGQAGSLKYLVSGGAGAPLYREITPRPTTRKAEATYHYILATVSDVGVAIVAKRPDGSLVDQCSFERGGSWMCDPPKAVAAAGHLPSPPPAAPSTSACGCGVPGGGAPASSAWLATGLTLAAAGVRRLARRRSPPTPGQAAGAACTT